MLDRQRCAVVSMVTGSVEVDNKPRRRHPGRSVTGCKAPGNRRKVYTCQVTSSNMPTHRPEWPEATEPGTVVGPAQSLWPWTVAWNRGNSDASAGVCYMTTMMLMTGFDGARRSRKNIHVSAFIRLSRGNARAAIKILRPRHYPLSKVQSVFSTGQAL